MTKRTTFALAVAGCVAVARLAGGQGSREAAAVRAARAAQNTALAARDLERAATFWTDDIEIRSGLGKVVQGKSAYRNAFVTDSVLVYRREPGRVDVSDNVRWPLAYESGIWTARVNGKGKPVIRGRYAAHWIKRNGKWLIRSELYVSLGCSGTFCSRTVIAQ